MSHNIKPIFIFSLPRSGSTFLQRIIATHPQISTASEPWLLLPLIYATRKSGSYAEYSYITMQNALSEFITGTPGSDKKYKELLNQFVTALYYENSKQGDIYFLDKTPRYHLIIKEIMEIFPTAKFIFLWRNPLAVVASALNTFGKDGKWRLYDYRIDFYKGLDNMHACFSKNNSNVHVINYEALVNSPDKEINRLFNFLELKNDIPDINSFSKVKLKGGAGDPTGVKNYNKVSSEPLHKWKAALCNPVRRSWARHYIKWIGKKRLSDMGYDYDDIMNDLDSIRTSHRLLFSDVIRISYGFVATMMETHIISEKIKKLPQLKNIYLHK
jgi:hypothetical protein